MMNKNEKLAFRPVKSRRLFEEVCEQVREQISDGLLKPGDKLPSERELAVQFGISRSAVREALRSLEFAGLIRLQKGAKGGSFVLGSEMGLVNSFENMFAMGRLTLEELSEVRLEIQDIVTRFAIKNRTMQDIRALKKDIARTQEELALTSSISDPAITQNFYALLAEATRNRVLLVMVKALSQMVYLAMLEITTPPLNFDIVAVRTRFVEALENRDEEKAREIMQDYLRFLHGYLVAKQRENKTEREKKAAK